MMIEVTTMVMIVIKIMMMTAISAPILIYYVPDLERKIVIKKLKVENNDNNNDQNKRDKITQMTNGELEKQIVSLSWKAISTQTLSSSAVTTPKKTV